MLGGETQMDSDVDTSPLLDGVRILDLSTMIAGPYGSMLLADMGAEVIKIEPPHGDSLRLSPPQKDGLSLLFAGVNRNKRSVAIDLQTEGGRELFLEMVPKADVVYANYRPDVMDRLGLSFEVLRRANPRVIVGNVSGFGSNGPRRLEPAYDTTIQGMSGGMSLTGHPGEPPARSGIPIADLSGGVFLALAVLGALHKRDRTGSAVELDLAMFDIQLSLLMYWAAVRMNLGVEPGPQGSGNSNSCPYGAYTSKDGHVIVGVYNYIFWPRFCDALGRADLVDDARFVDNDKRVENRVALEEIVNHEMSKRTTAEWLEILERQGIPNGPVNNVGQAMGDPQADVRGMKLSVDIGGEAWFFPGDPIRAVPDSSAAGPLPPPRLGEHTVPVLRDVFGIDGVRLASLAEQGVIAPEDPAAPRWVGRQYVRAKEGG
jgi:crotonobetainyl-CoA:carnitine CoA-transferase CaiB-like acyl-CoA transferase